MTERNINDINSFIGDPTQYKGEIFVNVGASTEFNTVKNFIDANHLIAFLPGENAIYAQGHKFGGLTPEQAQALSNYGTAINSINKKLAIIDTSDGISDDERESIIGSLTFGTGNDAFTETNVTDFVIRVLERVEAGDSAISSDLQVINNRLDAIDTKLGGITGTIKDYVDGKVSDLNSAISAQLVTVNNQIIGLGNSIESMLSMIVTGQYATQVTSDNDPFIEVELINTANTDSETQQQTPFVPPYTYKVSSKNIASTSDLQTVANSIDSKIATAIANLLDGAPQSLDTLKEIADWIEDHPEDTAAMNADINALKTKVANLLGNVTEEVEDPDTHEMITRIKTFTNVSGSLNGENWATSIEEINQLLNRVSFATNVQDNAEANKVDEVDFINQNVTEITGDSTDTSVKFGSANLNNKNVGISMNTDLIKKIKQNTLTLAASTSQTQANAALAAANAYTDEKLAWLIM